MAINGTQLHKLIENTLKDFPLAPYHGDYENYSKVIEQIVRLFMTYNQVWWRGKWKTVTSRYIWWLAKKCGLKTRVAKWIQTQEDQYQVIAGADAVSS